jgi:CubicO group peptidase (beta-lactamase class C family)
MEADEPVKGRGLSQSGVRALHDTLTRHVERGNVPGLVALVTCGDDAPVERWLPELADPRVLRTIESELDDTVPADRPITVEDVLSFHLGHGSVMAMPGTYPIQRAEVGLALKTYAEPWPPTNLTPDEWIARLGTLPLQHQPGRGWRYNTGAQVAGVLIERVVGAPIAAVLRDLVFDPLGMVDTDFYVPAAKLDRFTTQYAPDGETAELRVLDRPDGWWSTPPAMPSASGWLVSTIDDVWAFASMMASGGGDVLSSESVRLMTLDRMTASERAANSVFVGDHSGWGLMMSVPAGDGSTGVPDGFGWDGGTGTTWRTDPVVGLTGILLTQRAVTSPEPPELIADFWRAAYAAIDQAPM